MEDFKLFEVCYGDYEYKSQFDFDALRKADESGIIEMIGKQPMAFAVNVFYYSVLKHNPHANRKHVFDFAYSIIQDEDYGLHAFDDIVEDFVSNFTKFADEKNQQGKKKKKFSAVESPKVVNLPKEK